MSNNYRHNRPLPLAQKYEAAIMHQEMRDREKIIAEQCMARVHAPKKKLTEPPAVDADITIHVATHIKDNPGPGAYAMSVDEGTTVEVDYLADTTCPHLELVALNAAFKGVGATPGSAVIYTTAANTVKYLHDGTAARWKARGGRKAGGGPVIHWDLWAELLERYERPRTAVVHLASGDTPAMRRCAQFAKRPFQPRRAVQSRR